MIIKHMAIMGLVENGDMWREMGSPSTITVSVSLGDLLNG